MFIVKLCPFTGPVGALLILPENVTSQTKSSSRLKVDVLSGCHPEVVIVSNLIYSQQ